MREPWWQRLKVRVCRSFGHNERKNGNVVVCKRCNRLLRGPLG